MDEVIITLQGSAGGLLVGVGIAAAVRGHPWGYLLITAGMVASALYLVRATRGIRRRAQEIADLREEIAGLASTGPAGGKAGNDHSPTPTTKSDIRCQNGKLL